MKTLIVGYGNPLRSDDGIGPFVVERIGRLQLPTVTTRICHQIDNGLIEEANTYERVIFVDSSVDRAGVRFQRLNNRPRKWGESSGEANSDLAGQLSARLSETAPELFLCSVPAQNVNFGVCFSERTVKGAKDAFRYLMSVLATEIQYA